MSQARFPAYGGLCANRTVAVRRRASTIPHLFKHHKLLAHTLNKNPTLRTYRWVSPLNNRYLQEQTLKSDRVTVWYQSMRSGDGYQDGEGNGSSDPSCMGRSVLLEEPGRATEPAGENEMVGEQQKIGCVAEEGEKRIEKGQVQESTEEIQQHSPSADGSPKSTAQSGSTKSQQVEPGRNHTHQEMMQMVQEIKKRLPSGKKSCSKPNTVAALNYALNCVKQVQANSEYYKLLTCNGVEERKDAKVCSLERLEVIVSEHMLKNADTFVVVFSLVTGRVVYASEQASNILKCKRKFLNSSKFVELLFHKDINVFYSHTAQPHLPPWNVGTDSSAALFECARVKSFFCRIRGGKHSDGEVKYNPFRITPYLLKMQDLGGEEEHLCCLALAERIVSGYEAPRIPTDKRIFTTTHSPGCVFIDVDDRAVPLLGYLPQDLIGTSMLTCLHPDDRTLMLALHRKIVKNVSQPPFQHSPIRLRCQNGDYVTLDTSWSSFVNPWSRKVAFIIGRHKVRTGPLNKDVFAAQSKTEFPAVLEDVKELQAMIYKLFQQPVHTNGSCGYGSLGSNGSPEQYISMASSSDSNWNLWEDLHQEPVTFQQICANINKVKSGGQQAFLDSQRKGTRSGKVCKETPAPNCNGGQKLEVQHLGSLIEDTHRKQTHAPSYQQINCVDSIIRYLESCSGTAMKRKSKSPSIVTSSVSTTSEEDKTPAAPLEDKINTDDIKASAGQENQVSAKSTVTVTHTPAAVIEAPLTDMSLSTKAMSVVSATSQCSFNSTTVHYHQPEVNAIEEALTGSKLADTAPIVSVTRLRPLQRPPPCSSTMAPEECQIVGLTKEVLSVHTQKEEQEYVDRFRHRILGSPYSSYLQQDNSSTAHSNHSGDFVINTQSTGDWNRSHSGKPQNKRAKPQASSDSDNSRLEHFLPMTSPAPKNSSSEFSHPNSTIFSPINMPSYYPFPPHPCGTPPSGAPVVVQSEQMHPVMTPVMAFIMPYPYSYTICPQPVSDMQGVSGVTSPGLVPPPIYNHSFVSLMDNPLAQTEGSLIPSASEAFLPSPISSSLPEEDVDGAQPTVLFSRSSSPLQLNLLQEELPKPNAAQSNTESLQGHQAKENASSESGNQDAQSTSSVLLDILLQEDAQSGTSSNASGSGSGKSKGSGSGLCFNGISKYLTGSSNSSKYFASNDSSDTSCKDKKSQDAPAHSSFNNRIENSLWTMIQQMPEPVMMTYQIHPRNQEEVLKKDREKLLLLQPMQPWFTQEQKEELAEVHSWIQYHNLPEEINTIGCTNCNLATVEGATHTPSLSALDSSLAQGCATDVISPVLDT